MNLAAIAVLAALVAPGATTGSATNVTQTAATLNGSVDPNGSATTYHFEYGTTTAYGLTTPDRTAGDGDTASSVSEPVQGLTGGTTYHVRIVATSAGGPTNGADRTFKTAPNPRPPGVRSTGATDVGPDSAMLRSSIDPNDGATTYHFEYGSTASYGTKTPERGAPGTDGYAAVSEPLTGLKPYKRYHFRVVATNAAGTTASSDHAFSTARQPTSITISIDSARVPWGEGAEVFGKVTGIGAGGIPVGVERQDFPFSGPFSSLGTPLPVRANSAGVFRMFIPQFFSSTRLQAVTRTAVAITSTPVLARVVVKVGIATRRLGGGRVRLRGSVVPAVPNGRAVLQRRTRGGGWTFVAGRGLSAVGANRSRYTFAVPRKRTARDYRVRVVARDGGAHYPGMTRAVTVPAAKR
ncbi:MAG: hypothetical protein QOE28_2554 [Solirubrobacteraceae bacterium]|nr:hypothetical protein [Solirubrobacteraceae bacterium]